MQKGFPIGNPFQLKYIRISQKANLVTYQEIINFHQKNIDIHQANIYSH